MQTQEELELIEIYRKKQENGLVNVSFCVDFSKNSTKQDLILEILAFEKAIQEGKTTLLEFGDLEWKDE